MSKYCSVCQGEGSLLVSKPAGWFDPRAESWYPSETVIQCPKCRGSGQHEGDDPVTVFNGSPEYARLKARRSKRRTETNRVVALLLGISPRELAESEEAA